MLLGGVIAVVLGGLVGWWLGASRATGNVNRQWMRALEQAETDGIINDRQRSDVIRIQGSFRT
ncbi:MAG: hypothetical protein ACOC0E_05595 [Spirochaetota bacterium]